MTTIEPFTLTPALRRHVSTTPDYGPVAWTVRQLAEYARQIRTQHRPLGRRWRMTVSGPRTVARECAACLRTWPCRHQEWCADFEWATRSLAPDDLVLSATGVDDVRSPGDERIGDDVIGPFDGAGRQTRPTPGLVVAALGMAVSVAGSSAGGLNG